MAGKRQHYVPRFLQRGFLADTSGDADRTWLHRRNAQARLVGIRDVGVGDYFYSRLSADGAATLDDMITAIEREIDGELSVLKEMAVDASVNPSVAARLTTHLTLRTAHVRAVFEQGAIQVFDATAKIFADPDVLRDHLDVDELQDSNHLGKAIEEALQIAPLDALKIPRELAKRLAKFTIREQFETHFSKLSPELIQALNEMTKRVSNLVRDAHNKALEKTQENKWEERLSKLSWRIQPTAGAVLPDCIALAHEIDQGFTPFLLSDHAKVDLVVIPLAHDRVLVGSKGVDTQVALDSLNRASAACSDSFFISRNAEDGEELVDLIGQRSALAIQESVTGALANYKLGAQEAATKTDMTEPRISATDSKSALSYSLNCIGFADQKMAESLNGIIKVIIQEMSRVVPISTLDGITFAQDYAAAIEQIDRGDPLLPVEKSQPRSYGQPVAKLVHVLRGGEEKTHLVIGASIAGALLSDDEEDRIFSAHMIITMLAGLAHRSLYEARLAGKLFGPDEIVRILYSSISAAPGSYYGARTSAFIDPGSGERYAELVIESYASAREDIGKARIQYRYSNNIDELLDVALSRISFVLNHAAEWLGHRDGLGDQEDFPGSNLPDHLKPFGLHLWLDLFGRDLRNLYDLDGHFTIEQLSKLTRHVERLLWTLQIFPWPMEDGKPYISVPIGDDAAILLAASSLPPQGS